MGQPKRLYPLGKFRHRVPKDYEKKRRISIFKFRYTIIAIFINH